MLGFKRRAQKPEEICSLEHYSGWIICTHMTYEECLVTRQLLDQDKRFAGTVFSRRKWDAGRYSVSLQLKNGQEFEFSALEDFRSWHARYRKRRKPLVEKRQRLAALPF